MPTQGDIKLASARLKIERAKQHIADLDSALGTFYASNPYKVGTNRDPQERKLIYYLMAIDEVPPVIPAIAGDVIHSLRCALDHLAFQLFLDGGGLPNDAKHVYFPIARDAATYKTDSVRKVKGMRKSAVDAINAVEPYGGGKGNDLWILHQINNIDKHRLIIMAGSAFRSLNLGAHLFAQLEKVVGHPIPRIDAFFRPADRLCPLKLGDELFVDAADAEVNEQMQFRFEVAFNESQVIESESIRDTIHHLTNVVDNLITQFVPLL